jgi:hypothetical protein
MEVCLLVGVHSDPFGNGPFGLWVLAGLCSSSIPDIVQRTAISLLFVNLSLLLLLK